MEPPLIVTTRRQADSEKGEDDDLSPKRSVILTGEKLWNANKKSATPAIIRINVRILPTLVRLALKEICGQECLIKITSKPKLK